MRPLNLESDGCELLPGVFSGDDCRRFAAEIAATFANDPSDEDQPTGSKSPLSTGTNGDLRSQSEPGGLRQGAIGAGQGVDKEGRRQLVGGRNLIDLWRGWREIVSAIEVGELVRHKVGRDAGLVRILYFDKPPGHGWALALHRDRTIAVSQHHVPPTPFGKPTLKAGVPHVVANHSQLRGMLTLRLHLDPMHDDNGPLTMVPGSHRDDDESSAVAAAEVVHADVGDIFVMRPLLLHGSLAASTSTTDHRRVIHLEFAAAALPSPYQWHRHHPIATV